MPLDIPTKAMLPMTEAYEDIMKLHTQSKRGLITVAEFNAQLLHVLMDMKEGCIGEGVDSLLKNYRVVARKR